MGVGENAEITPSCVWTSSFRSESSGGVTTGEPMKIPMYVRLSKDIYFFSTLITMLPWCPWTLTAFLLTWGSCSHIQVSCWSQSVRRLWKLDSRLKSQFQHTATCQTYSILSTTPKIAGFSTPKQLYMPGGGIATPEVTALGGYWDMSKLEGGQECPPLWIRACNDTEGRSGMPIISQKSGIRASALALGGDGMLWDVWRVMRSLSGKRFSSLKSSSKWASPSPWQRDDLQRKLGFHFVKPPNLVPACFLMNSLAHCHKDHGTRSSK